jgi:hypothetical protein
MVEAAGRVDTGVDVTFYLKRTIAPGADGADDNIPPPLIY